MHLGEAPEPEPLGDEAVVAVTAVSLNRGEVRRLEQMEPDTVPGWARHAWATAPGSGDRCPPRAAELE